MLSRLKSQRGDTIVEVMIALGVLTMVIVSGYSISTRSINGIRASQERSEALKIAESQIELLRAASARAGTFTELTNRGLVLENNSLGASSSPPKTFTPETDAAVNAFCFVPSVGILKYDIATPHVNCIQGRYVVAIQPEYVYVSSGSPKQISVSYKVDVSWSKVGGGEEQRLSLGYKVTVPET